MTDENPNRNTLINCGRVAQYSGRSKRVIRYRGFKK